jgi:hypothetical protein
VSFEGYTKEKTQPMTIANSVIYIKHMHVKQSSFCSVVGQSDHELHAVVFHVISGDFHVHYRDVNSNHQHQELKAKACVHQSVVKRH